MITIILHIINSFESEKPATGSISDADKEDGNGWFTFVKVLSEGEYLKSILNHKILAHNNLKS